MDLSIVLVNYNTLDLIQQCLEYLNHLADSPVSRIVIVDNGSTDGSRQWLQSLNKERYHVLLSDRNLGFAGGCNLGIQHTTSNYILLLNTDAFLSADALAVLTRYLDEHPDVGIVGPQLLYPDGSWQRSTGLIPSPRSAMLDALGITSMRRVIARLLWQWTGRWWFPYPVEYLDGACMLLRRDMLNQIGGLDERFFFYMEDADLCYRARQRGWQVFYVPQSRVVHLRGGSSSQKNLETSIRLRVQSERIFILSTQGRDAWQRFLFWRRWNYRARMYLACLFGQRRRKAKYRLAWQVYREASSWTSP